MSSIKSICIDCIDSVYSADYIMQAFYNTAIASINRVTLIPIKMSSGVCNKAYISIAYWHDSETAYNFIKCLKIPNAENRFVHDNINGLWWTVKINFKLYITEDKIYKKYTYTNSAFEYQNEIVPSIKNNSKKINILKKESKAFPPVKTNTNGAKLLAYIKVKEDNDWDDIEKDLNDVRNLMVNQDPDWYEIEQELNNTRIMMQKLDYNF
jgi:hypothetical protein